MISPRRATSQNEASGRARRRQRLNTVPKNDSRVFHRVGDRAYLKFSTHLDPSLPAKRTRYEIKCKPSHFGVHPVPIAPARD